MKRRLAAILAVLLLFSTLSAGATEGEDWLDEMRVRKMNLGMPYVTVNDDGLPTGNVSVNGRYLTTGVWSVPLVTSMGDVSLPVHGFLFAADARERVAYRDKRINYDTPSGNYVVIQNDSQYLSITKNGKTRIVDMDYPTQPRYGDQYIENRLAGEMLGYSIAYDREYDAVHFTDWQGAASEMDKRLNSLNQILSAHAGEPVSAGTLLLRDYPQRMHVTGGVPPLRMMYKEGLFARALLGDNAFTVRETGHATTYTSRGNAVRLAVWASSAQNIDNSLLFEYMLDALPQRLPEIDYTLTFRTYDGALAQARLVGSVKQVGGEMERFSVNFMDQEGGPAGKYPSRNAICPVDAHACALRDGSPRRLKKIKTPRLPVRAGAGFLC